MPDELRCLAIRQPWAWAIAAGAKNIENRSWTTDYRGPVVLQASVSRSTVNELARQYRLGARDFAYGALVGVADLVDVSPIDQDLEANPWAWGPYCWRFANARMFRAPLPLKGKLNLYTLDARTTDAAHEAIADAVRFEGDDSSAQWLAALADADPAERQTAIFESYIALKSAADATRLAEMRFATVRNADTLVDLARARLLSADYAGAIGTATHAIELDGGCARAYAVRSDVYAHLSEMDEARAIELDPSLAHDGNDAR